MNSLGMPCHAILFIILNNGLGIEFMEQESHRVILPMTKFHLNVQFW